MSGTDWMMGRRSSPERESSYDTMQVCWNGHLITDYAETLPQFRKDFCSDRGARTTTACSKCQQDIRGHYNVPGFFGGQKTPVPNYCHSCGEAYPWRSASLEAAREAVELALEQDAASAVALIPQVAVESPATAVAALKLSRILSGVKGPAREVVTKALGDVLAASAKTYFGL